MVNTLVYVMVQVSSFGEKQDPCDMLSSIMYA